VKVAGERTFDVPQQTVWEVLNDPARLAKTIPGVDSFEVDTEERPIEYASLKAKGDGVGAIMSMQTQFELSSSGSETRMHWEADVSIAGPVGSMGQRVLQPIVQQQVSNVLDALDKQVQEAAQAA
jgi:carbon monoxide dehydrogenase subunit G